MTNLSCDDQAGHASDDDVNAYPDAYYEYSTATHQVNGIVTLQPRTTKNTKRFTDDDSQSNTRLSSSSSSSAASSSSPSVWSKVSSSSFASLTNTMTSCFWKSKTTKKKKQYCGRTFVELNPHLSSSLMQAVIHQDWQQVLIRARLYSREVHEFSLVTVPLPRGKMACDSTTTSIRLRLLPLHVACGLDPPPAVIRALMTQHILTMTNSSGTRSGSGGHRGRRCGRASSHTGRLQYSKTASSHNPGKLYWMRTMKKMQAPTFNGGRTTTTTRRRRKRKSIVLPLYNEDNTSLAATVVEVYGRHRRCRRPHTAVGGRDQLLPQRFRRGRTTVLHSKNRLQDLCRRRSAATTIATPPGSSPAITGTNKDELDPHQHHAHSGIVSSNDGDDEYSTSSSISNNYSGSSRDGDDDEYDDSSYGGGGLKTKDDKGQAQKQHVLRQMEDHLAKNGRHMSERQQGRRSATSWIYQNSSSFHIQFNPSDLLKRAMVSPATIMANQKLQPRRSDTELQYLHDELDCLVSLEQSIGDMDTTASGTSSVIGYKDGTATLIPSTHQLGDAVYDDLLNADDDTGNYFSTDINDEVPNITARITDEDEVCDDTLDQFLMHEEGGSEDSLDQYLTHEVDDSCSSSSTVPPSTTISQPNMYTRRSSQRNVAADSVFRLLKKNTNNNSSEANNSSVILQLTTDGNVEPVCIVDVPQTPKRSSRSSRSDNYFDEKGSDQHTHCDLSSMPPLLDPFENDKENRFDEATRPGILTNMHTSNSIHQGRHAESQKKNITREAIFSNKLDSRSKQTVLSTPPPPVPSSSSFGNIIAFTDNINSSSHTKKGTDDADYIVINTKDIKLDYTVLEQSLPYYRRRNRDHRGGQDRTGNKNNDKIEACCKETRLLPIHIACLYGASISVIQALLQEYPESASMEVLGMLPVHMVAASWTIETGQRFHKSASKQYTDTIAILLDHAPETLFSQSKAHGLRPSQYVRMLLLDGDSYSKSILLSSLKFLEAQEILYHRQQSPGQHEADQKMNATLSSHFRSAATTKSSNNDCGTISNDGNHTQISSSTCTTASASTLCLHETFGSKYIKTAHPEPKISVSFTDLLKEGKWGEAFSLLESYPKLARVWDYQPIEDNSNKATTDTGSHNGSNGRIGSMTPLSYPSNMWKRLPIHIVCGHYKDSPTLNPSSTIYADGRERDVMPPIGLLQLLLSSYPDGLKHPESVSGSLPLHLVCASFGRSRLYGSSLKADEGSTFTGITSLEFVRSRLQVLQFMLTMYPFATKSRDSVHGRIPLHHAVLACAPFEVIRLLVYRDPRSIVCPDQNGMTPLAYAEKVYSIDGPVMDLLELAQVKLN